MKHAVVISSIVALFSILAACRTVAQQSDNFNSAESNAKVTSRTAARPDKPHSSARVIHKQYFRVPLQQTGATPVLWTTGLMAPEAYVLKAAIDGWVLNESGESIKRRAAGAYNSYQKCGLKAALNLFTSG